jgi:hypothetical protein
LVLKQVAAAVETQYRADQVPIFLHESGVPLDRLPHPAVPDGDVYGVLAALDQWGSEGRRILRQFLGSWLDDRLLSGPDNDVRATVLDQLARQGWYVTDDRLVIGERAPGGGRRHRCCARHVWRPCTSASWRSPANTYATGTARLASLRR